MASIEDLEFPINANSFLCLEWPETFCALITECQENPSLLVSENEHNEIVPFDYVPMAQSDVHPSRLIENSNIDQETTTLTQNQSFHQRDAYPKDFNAVENFHDMPSFNLRNGQTESVYSENGVLSSTNKMMTTGLQSIDSQHGFLKQSHQQTLLCQRVPDFSEEPYVSAMVRSTIQEVEQTNGHMNLNIIRGLQDHHFYPPMFQEEKHDRNSVLFEKLKRVHENEQMQQPKSSNLSTPISVGTLLNNQCQNPFPSTTPNIITNPEYRIPMISNTSTLKKSGDYSPFTNTSYESDPFAYAFQNASTLKPPRRTRGRPRRCESSMPSSLRSTTPKSMPLVPTPQVPFTSPRPNYPQNKGNQHVTAMSSLNPIIHNQCQNSYTHSMIQQSGELRQRNCYDQIGNEYPSKIRRIMSPFQDKSIADSSSVASLQDGERSTKNTVYDPLYARVGLPIDPHLRSF